MRPKLHQTDSGDDQQFGLTALKLIVSPLADEKESRFGPISAPRSLEGSISYNKEDDTEQALKAPNDHESGSRRSLFKPREEANHAELFFDLFFVANLTVFSQGHEITAGRSRLSPNYGTPKSQSLLLHTFESYSTDRT